MCLTLKTGEARNEVLLPKAAEAQREGADAAFRHIIIILAKVSLELRRAAPFFERKLW